MAGMSDELNRTTIPMQTGREGLLNMTTPPLGWLTVLERRGSNTKII
jgi:hypothetical protein